MERDGGAKRPRLDAPHAPHQGTPAHVVDDGGQHSVLAMGSAAAPVAAAPAVSSIGALHYGAEFGAAPAVVAGAALPASAANAFVSAPAGVASGVALSAAAPALESVSPAASTPAAAVVSAPPALPHLGERAAAEATTADTGGSEASRLGGGAGERSQESQGSTSADRSAPPRNGQNGAAAAPAAPSMLAASDLRVPGLHYGVAVSSDGSVEPPFLSFDMEAPPMLVSAVTSAGPIVVACSAQHSQNPSQIVLGSAGFATLNGGRKFTVVAAVPVPPESWARAAGVKTVLRVVLYSGGQPLASFVVGEPTTYRWVAMGYSARRATSGAPSRIVPVPGHVGDDGAVSHNAPEDIAGHNLRRRPSGFASTAARDGQIVLPGGEANGGVVRRKRLRTRPGAHLPSDIRKLIDRFPEVARWAEPVAADAEAEPDGRVPSFIVTDTNGFMERLSQVTHSGLQTFDSFKRTVQWYGFGRVHKAGSNTATFKHALFSRNSADRDKEVVNKRQRKTRAKKARAQEKKAGAAGAHGAGAAAGGQETANGDASPAERAASGTNTANDSRRSGAGAGTDTADSSHKAGAGAGAGEAAVAEDSGAGSRPSSEAQAEEEQHWDGPSFVGPTVSEPHSGDAVHSGALGPGRFHPSKQQTLALDRQCIN